MGVLLTAGKSTLLKLMCGDLNPTRGDVKRHSHLSIGRYHQHSVDVLDDSMAVRAPPHAAWVHLSCLETSLGNSCL
jgi:ATPase subunit of ABC transporter with duplicated ATPase domains